MYINKYFIYWLIKFNYIITFICKIYNSKKIKPEKIRFYFQIKDIYIYPM